MRPASFTLGRREWRHEGFDLMSNFLGLLLNLLTRLSTVPGLGFLESYRVGIDLKMDNVGDQVEYLEALKNNTKGGARALKEFPASVKGSKKRA